MTIGSNRLSAEMIEIEGETRDGDEAIREVGTITEAPPLSIRRD
jgi:hypothetical protein